MAGLACARLARAGGPRAVRWRFHGGSQGTPRARDPLEITSSCAGEVLAASTLISLPQPGQRPGSSSQVRAVSLAQR